MKPRKNIVTVREYIFLILIISFYNYHYIVSDGRLVVWGKSKTVKKAITESNVLRLGPRHVN